ncbi:arylamine N-acetyltransferase 1 [Lipomyces tetrasporus]|uniref:Arylamine N-acetyltransferase 1 n=1 Tax=Lipomyces tetrasporus TaxID=54092 RepID=A0AAD7VSD8_9ASCO|nr:arylamine N-acetyltransferase 1 [Lipomyces tetrasporus]KAJ8099010.1 arylamine N-acetyltransferase 1 [Lipomyces tetrasporus]
MANEKSSQRSTYSVAQLNQYYERISLPISHRNATEKDGLPFLTVLTKYQMAGIPFENLELHYSPHHNISLDPQHLFQKMIGRGTNRGGYCMENNRLFGTVLRSLGFIVYSVGARVSEAVQPVSTTPGWSGPKYDGWNHMLNIVTIDGQKYLVDVGFGASGSPIRPLPLIHGSVSTNIGVQKSRLLRQCILQHTDSTQQLWCFDHSNDGGLTWTPTYAFTEMEFFPEDFAIMNYWTSTHPTSWFTRMIVVVKTLLEDGEVVGHVTLLQKDVKRRIRGRTEVLDTLSSEEERVQALSQWFGITLSEEEINGIRGMTAELL